MEIPTPIQNVPPPDEDQAILETIAARLLRNILPAATLLMTIMVVFQIVLGDSRSRMLPMIVIDVLFLVLFVFRRKFPQVLLARVLLGATTIFIAYTAWSQGTFRLPGMIGVTALAIIWGCLFTPQRIAIGLCIAIIAFQTLLAWFIHAGVLTEHFNIPMYIALLALTLVYSLVFVSIRAPVGTLFESVAASRKAEHATFEALRLLQESRNFTIQAIDNSRQLFGWLSLDGTLQYANTTALNMVGARSEDVLERPFWNTPWFAHDPVEQDRLRDAIARAAQGEVVRYELVHVTTDGTRREIDLSVHPIFGVDGSISVLVAEGRDITDERDAIRQKEKISERLHQSQKLEAVGQLAGGVAHDFNNNLSAIICAGELLKDGGLDQENRDEYVDMLLKAASRAGQLTRKLLAFSRKGIKPNHQVDASIVVNDTIGILQRTLDKNIEVAFENRTERTFVVGDDASLQNAILNIGINAGHAMPQGGKLTFSLESVHLDADYCQASSFELVPGDFLEISIRDTGCGMPPEIVSHIFEPFFTTKEHGKGTGLGLSAAYGTVQDHHGALTVYSEVGTGTVFHLYIPLADQHTAPMVAHETHATGTGTILLVDDEELVRLTTSALLKRMGYQVLLAEDGRQGVAIFLENQSVIDLVILDMIMPVMDGREAFEKIREANATTPVLIASGFSKEEDLAAMRERGLSGFLQKPFRRNEFEQALEEILGTKKPG